MDKIWGPNFGDWRILCVVGTGCSLFFFPPCVHICVTTFGVLPCTVRVFYAFNRLAVFCVLPLLRHLQWQLAIDHWFLNYGTISKFVRAELLICGLVFCVTWLWTWQKRQLWRVDRQSCTGLIYYVSSPLYILCCSTFRTTSFKCIGVVARCLLPPYLRIFFVLKSFFCHFVCQIIISS